MYYSHDTRSCPGGESVEEMTQRVDGVIAEVYEVHRKYFEDGEGRRDALIVAHVRSLELLENDLLSALFLRVPSPVL